MEYQNITNLFDTTSDNVPRFILLKNGLKIMISLIKYTAQTSK